MNIRMTEEEIADFIDDGISVYLQTLCMALEEGRNWQEAEANFRKMLTRRIASAIVQAVKRGAA